jgi:hypothetical protein
MRYTVVGQAFKWQQNWQQRGNRLATHWAGLAWFGLPTRYRTSFLSESLPTQFNRTLARLSQREEDSGCFRHTEARFSK